jgi:uncharacterized protein YqjF (DUF2071 family)
VAARPGTTSEDCLGRRFDTPAPRVDRPAMLHRWERLAFVHWRYPAEDVQRLLPDGLAVDTFDGAAWVGLVPFSVSITAPRVPVVPWMARFLEINVRTYVTGPGGTPGVWFISLDAERLGAVCVARSSHGLRYRWAKLTSHRVGDFVTYEAVRRWPGPRRVASRMVFQVGERRARTAVSDLEHFLTTRWRFYCRLRRRLHHADVWHEPWPLADARVLFWDDELIVACGLSRPRGEPFALYSDAIDVRMEWPRRSLRDDGDFS